VSVEELRALEDPQVAAERAGLRYINDDDEGLYRWRRGKGWSYHRADGKLITDPEEKERLRSLAIPPAWGDVWICPYENGHLLATGRDDRGRKQYIYHPDWRAIRDVSKYARMVPFARALPRIRRTVRRHLRKDGLPREKVLAAVVRLLERALIRVGNDRYAKENDSYGVASLRNKHVDLEGASVRLSFRGKAGKKVEVELDDPRLASVVKQVRDVPGYDLFQYFDEEGNRRTISSGDVNEYLHEISGERFTAKDFRTWAGTVQAVEELLRAAEHDDSDESPKPERCVTRAVERVAERLGNTPAVCRSGYIYPAVIDRFVEGELEEALAMEGNGFEPVEGLTKTENAVLAMLEKTLEDELVV
jgi:DNA topoisomerase-1